MNLPHTTSFDTTNITKSDYERLIRAERERDEALVVLKDLIFAAELEDPPALFAEISFARYKIKEWMK